VLGEGTCSQLEWREVALAEQSSSTTYLALTPRERAMPQPIIDPSTKKVMTDRMEKILYAVLPILEDVARRHYMPVYQTEVRGMSFPEDDVQHLVITQWVNVSAEIALDYWDKLSYAVAGWIDRLPPELQTPASERLTVSVQWPIND